MPPGFTAVTPFLTVEDVDQIVQFAKAAFGAEEIRDQRGVADDGRTLHAAFRIEGHIVEVGLAQREWKDLRGAIHLYVPDVDAIYARALKAGGVSLHDVRQMEYGERAAGVRDPGGNHWYIATYTGG